MKWILIILLLIIISFELTYAHESRPLHVEISEIELNTFSVRWKIPPSVSLDNAPMIDLHGCRATGNIMMMRVNNNVVMKQKFFCENDTSSIFIKYPAVNPSVSTLIQLKRLSGEHHTILLGPEVSEWIIPTQENVFAVAKSYTKLGVVHILKGIDHLLFIFCLLFIAGTGKRILITVTGFTIAHSITLALSTLNIFKLPFAPIEVVIALSIIFLATEIVRGRRDTLAWKYPIIVSSSFGLLHGFGFAAVLNEIGLPQTELIAGLLFFNVGVELGQIIFVITIFILIQIITSVKLGANYNAYAKPMAYMIGSLASYWMIDRSISIFNII